MMSPRLFGLVGILACAAIGFALMHPSQAADFAETYQPAKRISLSARSTAQVAITGNAADIFACCRPADFEPYRLGLTRVPGNQQINPASSENALDDQSLGRPVATAGSGNISAVIVPRIEVLSSPPFWANGTSAVVIRISLELVKGNERRIYPSPKEIAFRLAPANASFKPGSVRILPGADRSEPATLTSSQPATVEVNCTPEGEYQGLAINQSQPVKIEFLAPIDRVGLEPVSGSSTVNRGTQFLLYLYNHNDPKTHLRPTVPVSVQLTSQSENGILGEPIVELTNLKFSKYVRYVGTRMGRDTIVALAHYGNHDINGQSERLIVFPWWTFLAGLIGTLVGSLLRSVIGKPESRRQHFLESLGFGVAFCLIIIVFPIGTKLPQITTFLQPTLAFALGILVSGLGPEFLKGILSLVPSKG